MTKKVKMTAEQIIAVEKMVNVAKGAANIIWDLMAEHNMLNIDGCKLSIDINPKYPSIAKDIKFGSIADGQSDAGFVQFYCEGGSIDYVLDKTTDLSSEEYKILFADEDYRRKLLTILQREKELPPDGLWVSDSDDSDFLDSGVSVNDSLADGAEHS